MIKKTNRTKKKEERTEEILKAAKKVFFCKGYFSSSIEEIAKLAGISKGTVYLYFRNKDELYVSLMLPVIERYSKLLLEIKTDLIKGEFETGNDLIMKFYDIYSRLYKSDPEGLRIFQVYLSTDLFIAMPEKTKKRLWLIGKRNIGLTNEIITYAMKFGLLPKVKPVKMSNMLWGIFLGVVQWEDGKYRISKNKNYLFDALKNTFILISKGLGLNKNSSVQQRSATLGKAGRNMLS